MKVKDLVVFGAGLGIGAGITYFAMKKKVDEEIARETETIKKHYMNKAAEEEEKKEMSKVNINKPDISSIKPRDDEYEQHVTNYQSFADAKPEPDGHPTEEVTEALGRMKERVQVGSYLITDEDFLDMEDYDKKTLTYFMVDQVCLDEVDGTLYDLGTIVPGCWPDDYDISNGMAYYFRNDVHGTDFEIIVDDRSYARDVVGYDDED